MNFAPPPPPIERAAVLLAALCLGGATGFALAMLLPLEGLALAAMASVGGVALTVAAWFGLVGVVPRRDLTGVKFEPATFSPTDEATDELLLDDPVVTVASESRVVQLFKPEPLPEPGELAARIGVFLDSRQAPALPEPVQPDASAALHAALADIRRSLR